MVHPHYRSMVNGDVSSGPTDRVEVVVELTEVVPEARPSGAAGVGGQETREGVVPQPVGEAEGREPTRVLDCSATGRSSPVPVTTLSPVISASQVSRPIPNPSLPSRGDLRLEDRSPDTRDTLKVSDRVQRRGTKVPSSTTFFRPGPLSLFPDCVRSFYRGSRFGKPSIKEKQGREPESRPSPPTG